MTQLDLAAAFLNAERLKGAQQGRQFQQQEFESSQAKDKAAQERDALFTATAAEYQPGGDNSSLFAKMAQIDPQRTILVRQAIEGRGSSSRPSSVEEFEFFQNLKDPAKRNEFMNLKRAGFNAGGVQYDASGRPIVSADQIASDAGLISSSKAAGTETGKETARAKLDLPVVEFNAENMISRIDELLKHPGFKGAVGLKDPSGLIPGSPEQGALARIKQIQGGVFLQAYETLKGGGQITQIEGLKAEEALARLSAAQSEKDFKTSAEDFKREIVRLTDIARRKAGVSQNTNKSPQPKKQGGQIMIDANGNRAMVYPDGSFEEL